MDERLLTSLIEVASFVPEVLRFPSGWIGHLPFAAWIVGQVSPAILVELGTHSGNSYFAFCQSIAASGMASRCYAVDTWQGDEHAGGYGEEVFAAVQVAQQQYAEFSTLLRMTFDDAVSHFPDESIELLHIDGLHTYEAVRHDFETWRPKLAPGAVVLFHDTNVRDRSFGVWKMWEELQQSYTDTLEFVHGNGLGVLQLNGGPDTKKLEWLGPRFPEKQRLVDYFAALGFRQMERYELQELKRAMDERQQQITALDQIVAADERQISAITGLVADRDLQIAALNQRVAAGEMQIAALNQRVAAGEMQISALNQRVAAGDAEIAARNTDIVARNADIVALTHHLDQIKESHSWRITAPLRKLRRLTGK